MSITSVEAALASAASYLIPGQAHYRSMFGPDGFTPAEDLPWMLLEPIKNEIDNTPEIVRIASEWFQGDSGASLARAFVYRLFEKVDPSQIVADFLDLGTKNVLNTILYIGLFGGGVTQSIELDEGISIMPAVAAPPSKIKEEIFGLNRHGNSILQRGLGSFWKPNIALVLRDQMAFPEQEDAIRFQSRSERVQRAIRALTLASGYAFVSSWQATWIDHPAIPYEGFGTWNASGSFAAMPIPWQADSVDPILAKAMYEKLGTLLPTMQEPVGLAIDRLGRSRVHTPSADSALDLGIASEIILLHGSDSNSELSYRLSLHGAYLLDKDGQDREIIFGGFRSLYAARSQAAHRGKLKVAVRDRLPEFDRLCSRAIRAIVEKQQFPDWDRLTLGLDEARRMG